MRTIPEVGRMYYVPSYLSSATISLIRHLFEAVLGNSLACPGDLCAR